MPLPELDPSFSPETVEPTLGGVGAMLGTFFAELGVYIPDRDVPERIERSAALFSDWLAELLLCQYDCGMEDFFPGDAALGKAAEEMLCCRERAGLRRITLTELVEELRRRKALLEDSADGDDRIVEGARGRYGERIGARRAARHERYRKEKRRLAGELDSALRALEARASGKVRKKEEK